MPFQVAGEAVPRRPKGQRGLSVHDGLRVDSCRDVEPAGKRCSRRRRASRQTRTVRSVYGPAPGWSSFFAGAHLRGPNKEVAT
jgi:hypothetical protein